MSDDQNNTNKPFRNYNYNPTGKPQGTDTPATPEKMQEVIDLLTQPKNGKFLPMYRIQEVLYEKWSKDLPNLSKHTVKRLIRTAQAQLAEANVDINPEAMRASLDHMILNSYNNALKNQDTNAMNTAIKMRMDLWGIKVQPKTVKTATDADEYKGIPKLGEVTLGTAFSKYFDKNTKKTG